MDRVWNQNRSAVDSWEREKAEYVEIGHPGVIKHPQIQTSEQKQIVAHSWEAGQQ